MRRVLLLCLGVVSCASPDLPRVDGVPEDPGNHPPILPPNTTPESPVVPNDSTPTGDATEDVVPASPDAGAAGVEPVPSPTATIPTQTDVPSQETSGAPATSGEQHETGEGSLPAHASDAGAFPDLPCEFDGGFGDGGSAPDAGAYSGGQGNCDDR